MLRIFFKTPLNKTGHQVSYIRSGLSACSICKRAYSSIEGVVGFKAQQGPVGRGEMNMTCNALNPTNSTWNMFAGTKMFTATPTNLQVDLVDAAGPEYLFAFPRCAT